MADKLAGLGLDQVVSGNLFPPYFLEEGIRQAPEYETADVKVLEREFNRLRESYIELCKVQNPDEADTEDDLIQPFLEFLSFPYRRQKQAGKGITDRPDYLLFASEEDRRAAGRNKEKQFERGIAVLEAKRFRRALDRGDTDPWDRGTPSNQILRYLSNAEVVSNGRILWGILTNGQIWRLYYQRAKSRTDDYLEIDFDPLFNPESLLRLPEDQALEAFKLFYLLFRKEAFTPTTERPYQSFLEYALVEAKNYEEEVTKDLKKKIFEEVFIFLARGFVEDAERKGIKVEQTFLEEVYQNVLTLLYRLLFILYAEDRDLLPIRSETYYRRSLHKLKEEIYQVDDWQSLSDRDTLYWDYLENLFNTINTGDPSKNVPVYNGGLFQPNEFLESYQIADRYLARAIDLLSHDYRDPQHPKRISYRGFGVRQLGSIYEGLLEFKLRCAEEDLVVIKEKGKEKYLPREEAVQKNKRFHAEIPRGEIYLTNDKSERKATGSYYTPDYIVQYIVQETVEPLLKEIERDFNSKIDELKHSPDFQRERASLKTAKLEGYDPVLRALKLKILDPAMGSGHFLVAAVDYLAGQINEMLATYSGQSYFGEGDVVYESPIYRDIERIRRSIFAEAERQAVKLDETKLEDRHLIKRLILKRCIYGVDLNPMAVELAKVSLWLNSFTVGAPLSFLDHHLKCGNSLIGVFDVSEHLLPTSQRYRRFKKALDYMIRVSELADVTLGESQQSAELFGQAKELLEPFKRRLDISLAANQFLQLEKKWASRVEKMASEGPESITEKFRAEVQAHFTKAQHIADEKRFFHWELEFPEVSYQENGRRKENPGFDIVIGNPPYLTALDRDERRYLVEWSKTRGRELDTFYLFVEQSIRLLHQEGFCSMIIPNVFMLQVEAETFRKYLLQYTILEMSDYDFSVFGESTVPTATFVLYKSQPQNDHTVHVQLLSGEKKTVKQAFFSSLPAAQFNVQIAETLPLLNKVRSFSSPLVTYAESHEGVHSGNIRAKLFTRQPALPCAKKMLKGSDIDRYSLEWGSWWVNYDSSLIDRAKGDYASLREERIFTLPKIWTRQTGDSIIATWDTQGFYSDNTLHSTQLRPGVQLSPLYVVALLNSRIMTFVYQESTQERGRALAQVKIVFLQQLPIRRIVFTTPKEERARLVEEGEKLYQDFLKIKDPAPILDLVERCLPKDDQGNFIQEEEESDVVHDLLAFLAEQMIELNKQKQKEIQGFLKWIAREWEVDIEALALKTHLKEYHEHDLNELLRVAKRNKKLIKPDPESRQFQERLEREWKASMEKLRPLKEKIQLTDKLIDQIVYKLYGLTEEEIGIVEGSVKQ